MQTVAIPLTQGKTAYVAPEDAERVLARNWAAVEERPGVWYAVGWLGTRHIRMHRFIMGVTDPSIQVDHRDGDGLNNVRSNLRVCDNGQNQANRRKGSGCSSQSKGVCWDAKSRQWRASIRVDGRKRYLGLFDSEEDAARQYAAVAFLAFGEFARV